MYSAQVLTFHFSASKAKLYIHTQGHWGVTCHQCIKTGANFGKKKEKYQNSNYCKSQVT